MEAILTYFLPRAALLAPAALMLSVFSMTPATAASERVKNACTSDYLKFCSQYDPDSFQTVNCMTRNQNRVSRSCRTAYLAENQPVKKKATLAKR
jgi:hypothetical protein